jgi:hypothetical protein
LGEQRLEENGVFQHLELFYEGMGRINGIEVEATPFPLVREPRGYEFLESEIDSGAAHRCRGQDLRAKVFPAGIVGQE